MTQIHTRPTSRRPGLHVARAGTAALCARFGAAALCAMALAGCVAQPVPQSPGAAPGYGYTCSAGFYVCKTPQQVPLGAPCSCPGLGAPSYGTVQ